MFTKRMRHGCSRPAHPTAKFLAERKLELAFTFADIADLAEERDLWELETQSKTSRKHPITFTVPTAQLVASIWRVVE